MPRPRNSAPSLSGDLPARWVKLAEALGEAVGRGIARGLASSKILSGLQTPPPPTGRRGRPPKAFPSQYVPPERRCSFTGCPRAMRSKGLCSAHYQAERRRTLLAAGSATPP